MMSQQLKSDMIPISTDLAITNKFVTIGDFFSRWGWALRFANLIDGPAYRLLLNEADVASATHVLDIGAGNGHLASRMLSEFLPADARCTLLELSDNLATRLAKRFSCLGARVSVECVDGNLPFRFPANSFDRIVSCYVFDTMNNAEIVDLLRESHRLLVPNGILGILISGPGFNRLSKFVMSMWERLYKINPRIVGFSRAIDIRELFDAREWGIVGHRFISCYGFVSQALVVRKLSVPTNA